MIKKNYTKYTTKRCKRKIIKMHYTIQNSMDLIYVIINNVLIIDKIG